MELIHLIIGIAIELGIAGGLWLAYDYWSFRDMQKTFELISEGRKL